MKPLATPATIAELLWLRAEETPDAGYRFLADGAEVEKVTYPELDRDARRIAARLRASGVSNGAPVLLLYPPGLDFVRGFFGCLYAGAAAVPLYPPNPARLARTLPRLRMIAADCGAKVVLASGMIADASEAMFPRAPELALCKWIATDRELPDASAWKPAQTTGADLALLQYTSGSTREPRGVMLTHGNLLHNQTLIRTAFDHKERAGVGVSWLPLYHDMGLIGMVLQPLYIGASSTLMSPLDFLQSPFRWLKAASDYRATHIGAPNFGFELALRKITDEQTATLDLSSVHVAFCGAEPVREDTMLRFAKRFGAAKLSPFALLPCYGLAEATLIVSGARRSGITVFRADGDALRENRLSRSDAPNARPVVGCGPVVGDQEVVIVSDGKACETGRIGEIWVKGGSVGQGYWRRTDESREVFGARLDDGRGPFLRTGDLGAFDENGELYVTGRVKDLLIVRGLNHYPHDLEKTVEEAVPGLRPGGSVAFAIEGKDGDDVAIVSEYDPRAQRAGVAWSAVVDAVRSAVAEAHEITPRTLVFVAAGQIPKTPSGKVQRSETKRLFLDGKLEVLHRWNGEEIAPVVVADTPLRTKEEVSAFLTSWLSECLGRPIGADATFAAIGLDSIDSVRLVDELSLRVGRELNPILTIDYPSIDSLAEHLAEPR